MTLNLTATANHPANGPLPVPRIERVIEVLKRSNEYQNGGNMAYVIADAIKGLEELLVSREAVPVAYIFKHPAGKLFWALTDESNKGQNDVMPVYTAPPATTLTMDYHQGHQDGLEWAAQLAEAGHPQTGDWLYDDPVELAKVIRKGPDMPAAPQEAKS